MNTDKIYAEHIVNKYSNKDTTKVQALRRLDNKAKLPSIIFTYTFGIIAALIMGVGMCMAMKVIGDSTLTFVFGIIIGIIGIFLAGINYPIFRKIEKYGKDKYACEIMKLAKEITEEEK